MATKQDPDDIPALPPPEGTVSNFDNPPSFHAVTVGIGVTCMVIMTLAVSVRTYTKAVILKDVKHEDYVAILALIGFLAWCAIYIYLSSIGLTRDLWNIRAADMPHLLYMMNVFQTFYPPSMAFAKYFVCAQLKRIFCPRGSKRGIVWWALQILTGIIIAYYISCFFTFLFQCVPREKIWNPTIEGKCIDNTAGVLSAGIANLILDLGIFVVPIWAIWHLQLSLHRKLGALSIFAVGFFTCVVAALGVAYRIPLLTEADQTKAIAVVGLWTFAELAGTIVVGCMPLFPRFYENSRILQGPLSSLRSMKSLLSTKTQSTQNTELSRGTLPTKSTERIIVTSQFTREDTQKDRDYIELRDGEQNDNFAWRSSSAV